MKSHPQQNAPSPNRKVAEEIVRGQNIDNSLLIEEQFDLEARITLALDQKDQECREKVERVVEILASIPSHAILRQWKEGSYFNGDHWEISKNNLNKLIAAANEMKEGEE